MCLVGEASCGKWKYYLCMFGKYTKVQYDHKNGFVSIVGILTMNGVKVPRCMSRLFTVSHTCYVIGQSDYTSTTEPHKRVNTQGLLQEVENESRTLLATNNRVSAQLESLQLREKELLQKLEKQSEASNADKEHLDQRIESLTISSQQVLNDKEQELTSLKVNLQV